MNDKELYLLNRLRERILNKTYKEGDKMPSYIEVSRIYGCNMNVVRNVYTILKAEGIIELKTGIGYFVNQNAINKILQVGYKQIKTTLKSLAINNAEPFNIKKNEIINIINNYFDD